MDHFAGADIHGVSNRAEEQRHEPMTKEGDRMVRIHYLGGPQKKKDPTQVSLTRRPAGALFHIIEYFIGFGVSTPGTILETTEMPIAGSKFKGSLHENSRARMRRLHPVLGLGLCLVLSACASYGPRHVPDDRFNYNEAIGRSANQQMLLNLVRLRYRDVPVFLAVSGVLTQYVYAGRVGVQGSGGASTGDRLWSVGSNVSFQYVERPTITYSPLTGEKFSRQLLTPIPAETLFSFIKSGWPVGQLMSMGIERLNRIENVAFQPVSLEQQQKPFQHVVRLLIEVGKRRAMELQRDERKPGGPRYLVFAADRDVETQELIDELKEILGLDPNTSVFRVTRQLIGRDPDEITIRVRSLLTMMGYLSRGVQVPDEHAQEKRAEVLAAPWNSTTPSLMVPLRVSSSKEPPSKAFVAVEYQGFWFYIPHGDDASKLAFGLLTYLYQLQAPHSPTAGPLLTVPTG